MLASQVDFGKDERHQLSDEDSVLLSDSNSFGRTSSLLRYSQTGRRDQYAQSSFRESKADPLVNVSWSC